MRGNYLLVAVGALIAGVSLVMMGFTASLMMLQEGGLPQPDPPEIRGASVRQQPWTGQRRRQQEGNNTSMSSRPQLDETWNEILAVIRKTRFPDCPGLETVMKSPILTRKLPTEKLVLQGGERSHILSVRAPGLCPDQKYFLKLSCRPYFIDWYGRQAWPEIVASITGGFFDMDHSVTRARGIFIPKEAIDWGKSQEAAEECWFPFPHTDGILLGALMSQREDHLNDPDHVRKLCRRKDPSFLDSLFQLNFIDFLVLNTDRVKQANWFHDANGALVAMDNGAWAMHDNQRWLCDNERHCKELFEDVLLFRDDTEGFQWLPSFIKEYFRGCPWLTGTSSVPPVCRLYESIPKLSLFSKVFDRSSDKHLQQHLTNSMTSDIWFPAMAYLSHQLATGLGIKQLGFALVRDLSSCSAKLNTMGIRDDTQSSGKELVSFLVSEIMERYSLTRKTLTRCDSIRKQSTEESVS